MPLHTCTPARTHKNTPMQEPVHAYTHKHVCVSAHTCMAQAQDLVGVGCFAQVPLAVERGPALLLEAEPVAVPAHLPSSPRDHELF